MRGVLQQAGASQGEWRYTTQKHKLRRRKQEIPTGQAPRGLFLFYESYEQPLSIDYKQQRRRGNDLKENQQASFEPRLKEDTK